MAELAEFVGGAALLVASALPELTNAKLAISSALAAVFPYFVILFSCSCWGFNQMLSASWGPSLEDSIQASLVNSRQTFL